MEAGQWPEHIRIAVNLSPVQFCNTGLSSTVMSALASSQITPDRVELEITEGVFLQETNTTRLTLQQLHEMGGRLALRSEEHTSELQSLMRISYAVFCLKKKKKKQKPTYKLDR